MKDDNTETKKNRRDAQQYLSAIFVMVFGLGLGIGVIMLIHLFSMILISVKYNEYPVDSLMSVVLWAFGLLVTIFIVMVGLARIEAAGKLETFEERLLDRFTEIGAGQIKEVESSLKAGIISLELTLSCTVSFIERMQLASFLEYHGSTKSAREVLIELSKRTDVPPVARLIALCMLARNYLRTNELPEALNVCLQAKDIDPRYPETYEELGRVYGRMGLDEESADAYQVYLNDSPNDPRRSANLGERQYYCNKPHLAIASIKKAMLEDERYDSQCCATHIILAASYADLDNREKTLEALKAQDKLVFDEFRIDHPARVIKSLEKYAQDKDFEILVKRVDVKLKAQAR